MLTGKILLIAGTILVIGSITWGAKHDRRFWIWRMSLFTRGEPSKSEATKWLNVFKRIMWLPILMLIGCLFFAVGLTMVLLAS